MILQYLIMKEVVDTFEECETAAEQEAYLTSFIHLAGSSAAGAVLGGMAEGPGGFIAGAIAGPILYAAARGVRSLMSSASDVSDVSAGIPEKISDAKDDRAARMARMAAENALQAKSAAFQAFGMNAKTARLVAGSLHAAGEDCARLVDRMTSLQAELGDDGETYLVSFRTSGDRGGSISGMSAEQFEKFKAKVAQSDTPITVRTFGKESAVQEVFVRGEPLRYDPAQPADWEPARIEVRYDQREELSRDRVEAALNNPDSLLAATTFHDENGDETSLRQVMLRVMDARDERRRNLRR